MACSHRFPIAVMALAFACVPLLAQEPADVKDDAKLFKAETLKKVNEAIRDLDKKGIRLAVETYPAVPKESADKLKALASWLAFLEENGVQPPPKDIADKLTNVDTKAREEFFARWG